MRTARTLSAFSAALPGRDSAVARSWRVWAYALCLVFCVAWTLAQGKFVHWDSVNYHFYLGFSALNDRFATDFFAAGTPSYINPYAYVPLYLFEQGGMPAWASAIAFASLHALILWFTFELASVVLGQDDTRRRNAFAALAVVLALLNPVLLQGIGTTLVDISTGLLVVAAWVGIARAVRSGSNAPLIWAGLLCGFAAGLKLSNAVYAAAGLAVASFVAGTLAHRARAMLHYGASCAAAFAVVSVPWSLRLWQEFGNPLFPFLNTLFQSPDFTSAPMRYERFLPLSAAEFLARPFGLLSARSMVHTESRAPDMRYAILVVLLVAAAARWMLRTRAAASDTRPPPADDRVLLAVATGFAVAWCLWLLSSGNGRYFVAMSSVAAVLLAAAVQRFFARWRDATAVVAVVLLGAQFVQIAIGSDWKRDGLPWDGSWLGIESPERYRREPTFTLSTSFMSGSAFLPHWHPESGMMTISGFYALGPDRPGGARALAMLERHADRLRILRALPPGVTNRETLPGPPSNLDPLVRRFGLRVDGGDCDFMRLETNTPGSRRSNEPRERWTGFMSCRLVAVPGLAAEYAKEVEAVDAVFDRVEAACPGLFQPARPVTEQFPRWARLYNMGTEVQLWIENGRLLYRIPPKGGDPIDIGAVADWMRGTQPIDCSRRFAAAFGLVD